MSPLSRFQPILHRHFCSKQQTQPPRIPLGKRMDPRNTPSVRCNSSNQTCFHSSTCTGNSDHLTMLSWFCRSFSLPRPPRFVWQPHCLSYRQISPAGSILSPLFGGMFHRYKVAVYRVCRSCSPVLHQNTGDQTGGCLSRLTFETRSPSPQNRGQVRGWQKTKGPVQNKLDWGLYCVWVGALAYHHYTVGKLV